jgi:exportin-1
VGQTDKLLPPTVNLPKAYASGGETAQTFVRHLTIFLTGFLKAHLSLVESSNKEVANVLHSALVMLLRISQVNDETIFKVLLPSRGSVLTSCGRCAWSTGPSW